MRLINISILFLLLSTFTAAGEEDGKKETEVDLIPKIHGAFRSRFESEFESGINRFQVRNARISVNGMVAPSIDYFIQIDASDRGKMKFLDAYGRIAITDNFKFQAGQFREPFGVEVTRAPANYVFANRAFLGKEVCNIRGVGAKVSYNLKNIPLLFEAGAFNTTGIADHSVENKLIAFASKILWTPDKWTFATGFMSQAPYGKRVSLYDITVGWKNKEWEFLGEAIAKTYTHSSLDPACAYVVWGQRMFPVSWGVFNQASVQARFDGLTAHSNGSVDEEGKFILTDAARNRVTLGGTVTYKYKMVHADVRLNYEKYFYHSGAAIAAGADDKIVAELVIRF